ncbi:MAG: hypothetical protein H6936_15690 [Burkholderiales bacterium]|nr:hypothetical protein [Nitrosomonas sp.]MCP5276253.1 hypothetical protein [Burkholderiales bacterium]
MLFDNFLATVKPAAFLTGVGCLHTLRVNQSVTRGCFLPFLDSANLIDPSPFPKRCGDSIGYSTILAT